MSLEAIVMGIVGVLSGCFFTVCGLRAFCVKKPVSFWAGTKIDPAYVKDIRGYNREVGKMWLLYSVAFWLAGIAGFLNDLTNAMSYLFLLLLIINTSVGMMWMLNHYQKIAGKYIRKTA